MAEKTEKATLESMSAELGPEIQALKDAHFGKGKETGIKAERDRIAAIEASALPGHDELVAKLKADGTDANEAIRQIVAAEKTKKENKVTAIRADAPKPVNAAAGVPQVTDEEKTAADKKAKANPEALAASASRYQQEMKAKGVDISNADAVRHAYEEAGVPLE